MWIIHIFVNGEEGPEDRYVGPFSSEEDLEEYIEVYDLDSDWYVQVIPPDMLIKELVTVQ